MSLEPVAEPPPPAEGISEQTPVPVEQEPAAIFRCPQCRAGLFTSKSILDHEATKVREFANKRREYGDSSNECTSYFIIQPKWLDATGRMSDSILCPKCSYKIGHFTWKGSQCSCGEWIKPSFQILKARIDCV